MYDFVMEMNKNLEKARRFCALQERSHQELRDKLYDWGLHKEEVEDIIATMITENFLNEERFAMAYAGGKFRIKRWGKIKIEHGLRIHRISEPLIRQAIQSIEEDDYLECLRYILKKKEKDFVSSPTPIKKKRLLAFAYSKGFERQLVMEIWANERS